MLASGGRPCGDRLYSRSLFSLRLAIAAGPEIVLRRPIVSPLLTLQHTPPLLVVAWGASFFFTGGRRALSKEKAAACP